MLTRLNNYKKEIQNINLEELSKWSKEQMKGYRLPDNFMDTLVIEKASEAKNITAMEIKVTDLPSHSPLVKRALYIIPVFGNTENDKDVKKIFITIRGHVEE